MTKEVIGTRVESTIVLLNGDSNKLPSKYLTICRLVKCSAYARDASLCSELQSV